MNNRILTVKEAAAILRVSQSKLYQMAKEEKVPHIILGGRIVIPEKSLEEWISASVCGGGIIEFREEIQNQKIVHEKQIMIE